MRTCFLLGAALLGAACQPAVGTPVLPTCAPGQFLGEGSTGWGCFTPGALNPGAGIAIDAGTIAFDPSSVPANDVWNGTVPYASVTGAPALSWNTVGSTVSAEDAWPGTVPFSEVTGAPAPYTDQDAQAAVSWSTVGPSVTPTDTWPGTIPYSEVTGAPAPYTNAQAQAAVTWSTVAPSVSSSSAWPGTVPYSEVTGAPAPYTNAQAQAAVTWSTVAPSVSSSSAWPGTVPYSEVTGTPAPYTNAEAQAAVTWTTVAPSVSASSAWPGTVPYSNLTGTPANLATLAATVAALQSQLASLQVQSGLPTGAVEAYFGSDVPAGWLVADGSTIDASNNATYQPLVTHLRALGQAYQATSATGAILPDLRGTFLRGENESRADGLGDPTGDHAVGSYEGDQIQTHTHVDSGHTHSDSGHSHDVGWEGWGSGSSFTCSNIQLEDGCTATLTSSSTAYANIQAGYANLGPPAAVSGGTAPSVGAETRPRSVTVVYLIKL